MRFIDTLKTLHSILLALVPIISYRMIKQSPVPKMVRIIDSILKMLRSWNKKAIAEKRSGALVPGVAFVTGGARGLGNAIAVAFAKEGARGVVIVDIRKETLQEGKKEVESYGTKVGGPKPRWQRLQRPG
jgi:hypothetical protein